MRKIIILFAFSLFCIKGFSQNEKKEVKDFKKNEIKVNALYLILGAFEVAYERAVDDESAVGGSVLFLLDKAGDTTSGFALSPYYRFYFGAKPVSGFFMEGFSMYQNATRNSSYYNVGYYDSNGNYVYGSNYNKQEKVSALALGIGLGGKWYTKRGVMFEINCGIGRNISISSNIPNTDYNKITGKIGITAGYRF